MIDIETQRLADVHGPDLTADVVLEVEVTAQV